MFFICNQAVKHLRKKALFGYTGNMKILLSLFFILCNIFPAFALDPVLASEQMILANRRIYLPEYPQAFNPSLIAFENGFLLSFRYEAATLVSYIGVVLLDTSLQPISSPQLLNTRSPLSMIPSQSEDARLFEYRGDLFLIFNDNAEALYRKEADRRDMYMAKILYSNGHFRLDPPLKLIHKQKYAGQFCQKNWVPFTWNNKLLFSYYLAPHEVLEPDLETGICQTFSEMKTLNRWKWGQLRGGTAPQLIEGEYLAFFHSATRMAGKSDLHYMMGAYTFSASPPFEITHISAFPIQTEDFYKENRIIYPGGYAIDGPNIHIAYGKGDSEIWIATLDKNLLKATLVSRFPNEGNGKRNTPQIVEDQDSCLPPSTCGTEY